MVVLPSRRLSLGGQREIHPGQRQDAPPSTCVCDVREADCNRLPAGNRDAPHLLRSRLLCRSLHQRNPAS
jgi:hypothetical protein